MTGAGVLVRDKLFATLDPTTRRLSLPGGRDALLTDTVGFIRKIPHDLVAAFRATLEGIEEASLILHVVDSSHPHPAEQIAAVNEVLAGLELSSTPRLLVWNKIDLLPAGDAHLFIDGRHETLSVSARTGKGIPELLARMETILGESLVKVRVALPYDRYDLVKLVYEQGSVTTKEDGPLGVVLSASVPAALALMLAPFTAGEDD
jgi:GTP-binding protein HflX